MARRVSEIQAKILERLARGDEAWPIAELAAELGLDQSPVAGAVHELAAAGWVAVQQESVEELRLGPKATRWSEGLCPERRVARALAAAGGRATIRELGSADGLDAKTVGESLRWLAAREWGRNEKGTLVLASGWSEPEPPPTPDEILVAALSERGPTRAGELAAAGIDVEAARRALAGRAGVIEVRPRAVRRVRLTPSGRAVVDEGLEVAQEVNELDTELLVSGRWREVRFRPYDVTLPGRAPVQGRSHPFRRILEATRRVFLEMGFEEVASPWVESAFWDFDALFQPQDHPARDMQDTFYVARPGRARLPPDELVDRVRRTHEDGGGTGSIGWRTRWDRALAERTVLRTHTTAATVRELARDPEPPRKVFSVGPVFRRETIDYKHLPVFHQVDGIVVDHSASFAALLTLLSTFYRKMGFDRIQFRPAFFPYTEPSVEVFVWLASRSDWVEMGGAGVFREEVTAPLGCRVPVLAWGLGLERLAMFRFDLQDIRELYFAHLDWLEEVPQCRS